MKNETKFQINAMHAAISELSEDVATIRETFKAEKDSKDAQLDMMWKYIEHMQEEQIKIQNCMLSLSELINKMTEKWNQ